MARQTQQLTYNAFTGGIITEASPITFPDGASLDESNFELTKQGYRKRRLGMDSISASEPLSTTATVPSDITTYRWDNSSTTGQEFLVVAVRNELLIYDVTDAPPGDNLVYHTTISGDGRLSLTAHSGQLIIASGSQELTIIRSIGGDIFSERTERLRIRDREGIPAYKKDDSDDVKYSLQSATNSGYRPTSAEIYVNPRYDLPEDVTPPPAEPEAPFEPNRGDNSGNDGPR